MCYSPSYPGGWDWVSGGSSAIKTPNSDEATLGREQIATSTDPNPVTESEDADCPNQVGCLSEGLLWSDSDACALHVRLNPAL